MAHLADSIFMVYGIYRGIMSEGSRGSGSFLTVREVISSKEKP
jgi:hypothetical protein